MWVWSLRPSFGGGIKSKKRLEKVKHVGEGRGASSSSRSHKPLCSCGFLHGLTQHACTHTQHTHTAHHHYHIRVAFSEISPHAWEESLCVAYSGKSVLFFACNQREEICLLSLHLCTKLKRKHLGFRLDSAFHPNS